MAKRMQFVEVFRTDVGSREAARQIILYLSSVLDGAQVSFDLEDVDRILRIAAPEEIRTDVVVLIVGLLGHKAEVLSDTVAEPMLK